MKALVFGSTGQVATELRRRSGDSVTMIQLGRGEADLTMPGVCAAAIREHSCDVVINAAAYTAVDKAESEAETAALVNGQAPGAMAWAAAETNTPFLHISTDYVFDGSGKASWKPSDATAPLGVYGRTKLAGEEAIRKVGGPHAILRTSWVFSAHGANFVKTMLRLAQTRDKLTVVADQIGGPTAAADIADVILHIAKAFHDGRGASGIYHFAGTPNVSWADFAREIFAQSGNAVTVEDILTSEYPTPALRPANSRMDCSTLATDYGIDAPNWRNSLGDVLKDLKDAEQ